MSDRIHDRTRDQIVAFLRSIDLTVRLAELPADTFLPGIQLEPNGLVVDPDRLLYPGDLLHEAGHLAVMFPAERASAPQVGADVGNEIAAQCWSYAACLHLGLPPEVVFHAAGYKGAASTLIHNYSTGQIGVPLLQWMGLTLDAARAADLNAEPYPHMQRWLREQQAGPE